MMEPYWLDDEAALRIHELQIEAYGGTFGIRDAGLLSSALARPRHLHAFDAKATLPMLASAYAYGIVRNHPFVDGNKRTGTVVCITFLEMNDWKLTATDDLLCDVVLRLAAGEVSDSELASWMAANTRKME